MKNELVEKLSKKNLNSAQFLLNWRKVWSLQASKNYILQTELIFIINQKMLTSTFQSLNWFWYLI